jgi:hypothetical protein
VAWRWSFDGGLSWYFGPEKPDKFRFGDPDIIEPLYAAPPSAPEVERQGLISAARFLLWWKDRGKPIGDAVEAWDALRAALASDRKEARDA